MIKKLITYCMFSLSFPFLQADVDLSEEECSIQPKNYEEIPSYQHCLESVSNTQRTIKLNNNETRIVNETLVMFNDGMSFVVVSFASNNSSLSDPTHWSKGESIYITYDSSSKRFKLKNTSLNEAAWSFYRNDPSNPPIINSISDLTDVLDDQLKITLSNGYVFKVQKDKISKKMKWEPKDRVIIFANSEGTYQLWNRTKTGMIFSELDVKLDINTPTDLIFEDILGLEDRLNQKILQQPEATKAVASSLLIYSSGMKEKEKSIGIFLFLGPTGVGKTELAKVLSNDIYKKPSSLLQFDMTQFAEQYSLVRLIGSPPGYVDHEAGGQLTEPLKKNSHVVVLLDEMEKAHSKVHKMFLSVFDEGFILDSSNIKVDCSNVIFIMTSNLCGPEIAKLYARGYTEEKILEVIEPTLMKALSPELYNRVEPVLFRPIEKETMETLVDLHLKKLIDRLWKEKGIQLTIDSSLRTFLAEKGYHPLLGARPLNKLIQKRILVSVAESIAREKIEKGSEIILIYDQMNDTVIAYRNPSN